MRTGYIIFLIATIITYSSCQKTEKYERSRIDLQGEWSFQLDSLNKGLEENWQITDFTESVTLPCTTDTNKKGVLNTKTDETTHLSRIYSYVGKAWYKRQVDIPQLWDGKNISLTLERTKPTMVWVDGKPVGTNDNISTSQIYDLTSFLSTGSHSITVMVDNGESVPPQIIISSHAYTESTQTNWNGIIGEIYLEAANSLHLKDIQIYPDAEKKTVLVKFKLSKQNIENVRVRLDAEAWNTDKKHKVNAVTHDLDLSKNEFEIEYPLGEDALLWSEFNPALYKLYVSLKEQRYMTPRRSVSVCETLKQKEHNLRSMII